MVAELPHSSEENEDKLEIARALFKEGILVLDEDHDSDDGGDSDGSDGIF